MMYSIYVTNKSRSHVYVRLQHEKLSAVNPSFHDELDKLQGRGEKGKLRSYLFRWGFSLIRSGETMPFPVDVANDGTRKYASLCNAQDLWAMDFEMNCVRYGCLFVIIKVVCNEFISHFNQANPEPLWSPAKTGDALPANIVKVGFQEDSQVYFGRSSYNGAPRKVSVDCDGRLSSWKPINDDLESNKNGHILQDTGHEFVRAKTGDPVPPHAVVTGVSEPEGSLFLGRVGGNIPCTISTEGGNIQYFRYHSKKVQSGEILVLTNDPNIR